MGTNNNGERVNVINRREDESDVSGEGVRVVRYS